MFVMSKYVRLLIGLAFAVTLAIGGWALFRTQPTPQVRSNVIGLSTEDATPSPNFARAYAPRAFVFPQDHGPHPDFQTEWWYYTGNLTDAQGRVFGYQLTFFRRALVPPQEMPERRSDLASAQVYFAHFAMTDERAGKHVAFEKFSRGAGGLAGANAQPYHVFVEDWAANGLNVQGDAVQLVAQHDAYSITLSLRAAKPVVLQGDHGLSAKSDAPGNASYYYSFTRLVTTGTLSTPDGTFAVDGLSWMDHEWSTSALGPQALGWDWFSLQLSDESELMLFQVRNADGSIDPLSGGTLVLPDGSTRRLTRDQVKLDVLERWHSSASDADYPVRWRVSLAGEATTLDVSARLQDQENQLSVVYWEGAMTIQGQRDGKPVSGVGYVELTGYSAPLSGKF
jgi:predicted secreted hydrolase